MTRPRKTTSALLALDLVSVVTIFNLVAYLRPINLGGALLLWPLAGPALSLVVAIYLIDGYRPRTDLLSLDYASQHVIALTGALFATLIFEFVFSTGFFALQSSRLVIGLSFAFLAPVTLSYRRTIYLVRNRRQSERSLIFVGDHESLEAFRAECARHHSSQPIIFAQDRRDEVALPEGSEQPFARVLADIDFGKTQVEAIVLRESSRELAPETAQHLVELYFRGVPTFTLELFYQEYWQKIPLYRLNQTWLFQEGFQIAREPVFERAKRASDIFLAAVGLALSLPLVVAAGLAVWLEDRGPIFYFQTRIGRNEQPFSLVKLRTMKRGADTGGAYTEAHDQRITRVGRLLRVSRLDELPQLWNVLMGKMSLIGPRAEWERLVREYESQIPCYYFRHLVKPGITGWAQVNYPYGANLNDTIRKLEYDLYYIRHYSFVLDASIVLKTIHIMLFGKGR